MLTKREELAKEFMEKRFLPSIKNIIESSAPEKFESWGGNCCRQVAIFGAYYLSNILMDYRFTVWDGVFEDVIDGRKVKYNHAWIYGISHGRERKLFIDLGRSKQENIFVEQRKNAYDKTIPGYENIVEVEREQLQWVTMIASQIEYFTGLSGNDLIDKINLKIEGEL